MYGTIFEAKQLPAEATASPDRISGATQSITSAARQFCVTQRDQKALLGAVLYGWAWTSSESFSIALPLSIRELPGYRSQNWHASRRRGSIYLKEIHPNLWMLMAGGGIWPKSTWRFREPCPDASATISSEDPPVKFVPGRMSAPYPVSFL